MPKIIEKRLSLHKNLAHQQKQNNTLKMQIGQLQALANIGTTTCMIAHEINNLLTPLPNYATLALENPDDKLLASKALEKTRKNSQRASKIMESILAIANRQASHKESVELLALVDEVFDCLCRDFAKDRITVKLQIPEDLKVWAVPVEIQQVLMNLILNARDAMLPAGGTLTIKAQQISDTVEIEVCDSGCGIDPGDLENIFEAFFTTKGDKKDSQTSGSGLGLAFCKKILDTHKGSISVESEPGKTIFKIILPKQR